MPVGDPLITWNAYYLPMWHRMGLCADYRCLSIYRTNAGSTWPNRSYKITEVYQQGLEIIRGKKCQYQHGSDLLKKHYCCSQQYITSFSFLIERSLWFFPGRLFIVTWSVTNNLLCLSGLRYSIDWVNIRAAYIDKYRHRTCPVRHRTCPVR